MTAAVWAALLVTGAALLWPLGGPGRSGRSDRLSGGGRSRRFRWSGRTGRTGDRRAAPDVESELGRFLGTVATALDAGLPTGEAVRAACLGSTSAVASAELADLQRSLLRAAEAGRPTGPLWRAAARRSGGALDLVSAAWTMSETLGTPLADAVRAGALACRERADRQRAVATLTAGPAATIRLLTVLPVAGPAVVVLLGLASPALVSPVMVGSLLLGGVLLLVGRWWAAALTRRALRPPSL